MAFQPPERREIWAWLVAASLGGVLLYQYFTLQEKFEEVPTELGIENLIAQVKHDLETSEETRLREGKAPLFKVDAFDLEIHFGVRRSASSEGSARLEVVTLGGKTDAATERIQTITLHFKAVEYGGGGTIPGSSELIRVR